MKTLALSAAALAAMLACAGPAQAGEWRGSSAASSQNGAAASSEASGACDDDSCSSSRTWYGPYTGQANRALSKTCADGSCERAVTETSPNGDSPERTVTRRPW